MIRGANLQAAGREVHRCRERRSLADRETITNERQREEHMTSTTYAVRFIGRGDGRMAEFTWRREPRYQIVEPQVERVAADGYPVGTPVEDVRSYLRWQGWLDVVVLDVEPVSDPATHCVQQMRAYDALAGRHAAWLERLRTFALANDRVQFAHLCTAAIAAEAWAIERLAEHEGTDQSSWSRVVEVVDTGPPGGAVARSAEL